MFGILLAAGAGSVEAQRLNIGTGVDVTGIASSNPDLAPKGQEKGDVRLIISPYFSLTGNVGQHFRVSGSGDLGASLRLSTREGTTFSTSLRPSGTLNGTWEAVDNFLFVDVRAGVQSGLDDPFLPTTDRASSVNTSTSYQFGLTPYIRGQLPGQFNYEVRSDNSWTDSPNYSGQYSAINSISIERAPQPLGGAFSFQQQLLSSSVEGQSLLSSETARLSLRYALTTYLAVGARIGGEKYNYTLAANDWRRFYGAEISWRPNDRTSLEGYWEDRIYGNSWQLAFNYRRPQAAFNFTSSRSLSSTPQQFLTYPGLSNLASLLNASFTTRIPDPIERQRAVTDFLSRTQLPPELLTPTIIFSDNFNIQETNSANVVLYGQRHSLAFTAYWTSTTGSAGISSELPVSSKTLQKGTEMAFSRQMTPVASMTARASWRYTENMLNVSQQTTQTQLTAELTRQLVRGMYGTFGARYQWITSTVTNDATEAALYCTLNYSFN